MQVQIGEDIRLKKHETEVVGICQGLRVDATGELAEIWVEGFYTGFDLGPTDADWKLVVFDA